MRANWCVVYRALLLPVVLSLSVGCSEPLSDDMLERSRQVPPWFDNAKLGIFIHWGPASVPAFAPGGALQPGELEQVLLGDSLRKELPYAEWYLYSLNLPQSDTIEHHASTYGSAPYTDFKDTFEDRVDQAWDADAWAELFRQTGARYVVLVTKHHDGYALWPSDITNPNRPGWTSSRDMVGELAAAVRARGMRFGVYYSTGLDWTFKLVAEGDLARDVMRSAPPGQVYADYVHEQMRELVDRYHPDILWADIGYPSKGRQQELFEYYFAQVPEGAVNDRWGGVDILGRAAAIPGVTWLMKTLARWSLSNEPDTPEDDPARVGYKTAEYDSLDGIAAFKWESTRGLGSSFAYNFRETAQDMLEASELISWFIDTVAKNGNVLINVGPDSYGQIPDIQKQPLRALGEWMTTNGESIYGTRPWRRFSNLKGRELRYTQKDGVLYAIVYGGVERRFTIEDPGVERQRIAVLGAVLEQVESHEGMLTLTIAEPVDSAAVVVRFD